MLLPTSQQGGYSSRVKQIERQRKLAEALRTQSLAAPQGTITPHIQGVAEFGPLPQQYVAPSWSEHLARGLQQVGAAREEDLASKAEAENERMAREQAQQFIKGIPSVMGERAIPTAAPQQQPSSPFGTTEAGPVTPGTMLPQATAQLEQYTKPQEQYLGELSDYTANAPMDNPYLTGVNEKLLTQTLGGADKLYTNQVARARNEAIAKKASVVAQKNPVLVQEFNAMHPDLVPGTPEYAEGLVQYGVLRHGSSILKTAQGINAPGVTELLQFQQNPQRVSAIAAASKAVYDNAPAYQQQYGADASTMMQRDIDAATARIDSMFGTPQRPGVTQGGYAPAPAAPVLDPNRAAAEKTTAEEQAKTNLAGAAGAKAKLPQLDAIEQSLNNLLTPEGALAPGLTDYIGPRNARIPRELLGDTTNTAGDALEGLRSQITMLNLAEAKKAVEQSFGAMQVGEWEKFTNLLGRLDRGMTDATALQTLKSIQKYVNENREVLNTAISAGSSGKAPTSNYATPAATPQERAIIGQGGTEQQIIDRLNAELGGLPKSTGRAPKSKIKIISVE